MPISRTEAIAVFCFIAIFILVMVTFIIVILFRSQKKQVAFNNKLIEAKENHLKELFEVKLEVHEKITGDLSREIHDSVGQYLSLAKLGVNTLDLDRKDESRNGLDEISQILEKSLDDLRSISRTMNSEIVRKGGLIKSIEMQVGHIRRLCKYDIGFEVIGEHTRLDENKEMVFFRIVQEAINNIIRHSAATHINISLNYCNNLIKLQIDDDGKGFDIDEQLLGPNHLNGIYNMKHRAELIKADFQIISKIGSGTTIKVSAPY
jgi:signal transduction histidine kinase